MRPAMIAALCLSVALNACSHRAPTTTVYVIDTSLSITPQAERLALRALGDQISHLERGDRVILIPITGDAQNDAGGHVLSLAAPVEREPYDADLRRFRDGALKQFDAWTTDPDIHGNRTDILGALDLARQELAAVPPGTTRRLVVASDFIQDDRVEGFARDVALANAARARALAVRVRAERRFALSGVTVCLGRLESIDFASLSPERKRAVNSFWQTYLAEQNRAPEIQIDGAECLTERSGQTGVSAPSATEN